MICACWPPRLDLAALRRRAGQTAWLMLGVPDYEQYVAHILMTHPDEAPLTRDAFLLRRQAARYAGGGGLRCC